MRGVHCDVCGIHLHLHCAGMPLGHAWTADNKVLHLTVSALGVLAVWSLNVSLHACALAVPVSLRPKK